MKYKFYKSPHPYLCFASCLKTIIEGYCDVNVDEFEVAQSLGITLPNSHEELRIQDYLRSDLSTDWGIDPDTDKINTLLGNYCNKIACQYISAKIFEDYSFEDFLKSAFSDTNMVIFGFDYNYLFQMSSKEIVGHASVGISIIENKGDIRINIHDPGPAFSGQKQVSAFDMYVACKRKGGGIWLFEKNN